MKRKNQSSYTNKFSKKQFGGSTYVEKPKLVDRPLTLEETENLYNTENPYNSKLIDIYARDKYPEIRNINKNSFANIAIPNISGEGVDIHLDSDTGYKLMSEIPHADQYRKQSVLQTGINLTKDIIDSAVNNKTFNLGNAQKKTYTTKGTQENDAHRGATHKKINNDYQNFILELIEGDLDKDELNKILGKKQFGGSTYVEKPLKPIIGERIKDDNGNKIYRDGEGRVLASGETTPIYPETLLFPGSPVVKGLGRVGNLTLDIANPISGVVKNPSKINPFAKGNIFNKIDKESFLRQVDEETYLEALESGLIKGKQNIPKTEGINLNKSFGDDAYYNKGSLYYKENQENVPYLFESLAGEEKFIPKVNGRTRNLTTENTSVRVSKEPLPIKDVNVYKYNKYRGYIPLNQYGGTSQNILAEDGELYLNNEGDIQEVNSFSHDDPFIELPNGQKILSSKGNGGQILDDAQSVLSDSYTQVEDGDRRNTQKEQQVAIKSKDAKKLFDYKWFNSGKNKKYSPSELVKEVISQRDKKLSRYSDAQKQDALSLSTNQLNSSLMPDDEEIYNVVLSHQEKSKVGSVNKAQFGTFTEDRTTKNFRKRNADVINDAYDRINYENTYTDRVGENVGGTPETLESFDENKQIYKDYINSDLYRNRIVNNTQKLSDLYLTDTRKAKIKEVGDSDLYDVTSGRLNRRIDNIGLNSDFYQNGVLGQYDASGNVVSVDKNRLEDIDSTMFHEIGHATTPKINSHYLRDGYDLKSRVTNSLQNDLKTNTNAQKYYHTPGEIRSEIMELRKNLHNVGKPITEGNYSREDVNNLKTNQAYRKLKYVFSDDEIFELMNDLAYNENQQDPSIARAQHGGVKKFYQDYLKSPKFQQRALQTRVEDPDELAADRLRQINNLKITNRQINSKDDSGSRYFFDKNTINIDPRDVKEFNTTPENILSHEFGHAAGALKPSKKINRSLTMNSVEETMFDERKKYKVGSKEMNDLPAQDMIQTIYSSQPWESKADMDALRYRLKRDGIYDTSTQDFNKSHLQKAKAKYKDNRFLKNYKDEDIIYLMNNIAMNDDPSNNDLQISQYGGIPVNSNGLYEENGPVIIPGNNITMKNIKQNVAAIDADTGEYITVMNPNKNYQFKGVKNVLEVPLKKAQVGYDDTSRTPDRRIKIQGTNRTLNPDPIKDDYYVDQYGDVWQKQANGEFTKTEHRWQETIKPAPASYSEYMTGEDDKYEVRRGDWISSVAPMFGLTEDELLDLNPDIKETGKILPGQRINVMRPPSNSTPPFVPILEPEDRSAEIDDIQELPEEVDTQAEDVIPTLDVKAETVPSQGVTQEQSKEIADKIRLGKIDRTQGTNALREMMRANRSINLPYRAETPRRLFNYNEEDATPYLDEIDGQINQALQNVNQNTAQGQAIAANILNRAGQNKRQIINKVNQANLQRRQQIDNANVSLQNQFDMMQEQNNKNYVDETYQTLANYDRNKVQQAEYLDDMINNNTKLNNFFTLENMRNPNYQIDPVTGEIFRIGTPFKQDKKKAQYGIKRKK